MIPKLLPLQKPKSMQINPKAWEAIDREVEKTAEQFTRLAERANELNEHAGTGGKVFQDLLKSILELIKKNKSLLPLINSKMAVRALGLALIREGSECGKARLDKELLEKIDALRPRASSLFLRHMLLFYFFHYDQLYDYRSLAAWLKKATLQKREFRHFNPNFFQADGAKWLAQESQRSKRELGNLIEHFGLGKYSGGRFLFVAKNIYYLGKLKEIPVNKPNDLLIELQKPETFNARYDKSSLLGHEILRIIISRAPERGVDDSWQNVVMAIAGDPRIPKTDLRYQKWWSQIEQSLIQKVIGWLSRFDLRLFLEALEDFSRNSGNDDLKRMYPARKRFLQGLNDKDLVTKARLYLTNDFISYIHKHYNKEHLPSYSKVVGTQNKSIIYVEIGTSAHLIEGSHSCKLWIYRSLPEDAVVFNYDEQSFSYRRLTSGLVKSKDKAKFLIDSVVHSHQLTWQNKAINAINKTQVKIDPKDVLTEDDYFEYKRRFEIDNEY